MTKANRLFAVFMVLILALGTTGCMIYYRREESKVTKVLQYMHEKYDDEFTYSNTFNSCITLKSKKFPDANLQIVGNKNDNGEYEFKDNYVDCKYKEQTSEFLREFFEEVFECEVKVGYEMRGMPLISNEDFTNETTFDEYIHSSGIKIWFGVAISNKCEWTDEQIEKRLKEALENENLKLSGDLYFPDLEAPFEGFDPYLGRMSDLSAKDRPKIKHLHFSRTGENEYKEFEWSNN